MNYVLYGEEHYLLRKEIDRIIERSVTFEKEMNTVTFDATKNGMEEIIADAQTLPFFSDQKVVIVNHANFLTASDDTNADLEMLEKYIDAPNPSTVMIFTCEVSKLDSRKKLVKRLSKEWKTLQFNVFNDFERSQFVLNESNRRNIKFSKEALNEFYYRVGYSPARILNEMEKLSLYSEKVEREDVISLVKRPLEDNVFDIFKAILDHNFKRAYTYWKDFDEQNIDPIALIAMLASQFRFMHQVKILQSEGMNKNEIAKALGAHPFRVEKTMENCYQRSEHQINETLRNLALLDQQIKAGKIDKKLGFELFLIQEGK